MQVANTKYRAVFVYLLHSFVEHVSHLTENRNLRYFGSQTVINRHVVQYNILSTEYSFFRRVFFKCTAVYKNQVMSFTCDLQILEALSKIFCVFKRYNAPVYEQNFFQRNSYKIKFLAIIALVRKYKIKTIANLGELKSLFICGVNL